MTGAGYFAIGLVIGGIAGFVTCYIRDKKGLNKDIDKKLKK